MGWLRTVPTLRKHMFPPFYLTIWSDKMGGRERGFFEDARPAAVLVGRPGIIMIHDVAQLT